MTTIAFSRLADRLVVSDPGLLRFQIALRIALTSTLTGLMTVSWALHRHEPVTVAALAIMLGMVIPLFVREAHTRARLVSVASISLYGCASIMLAAVLEPYSFVADAGFLAVLFCGILCQTRGLRALGCALGGVVAYYLGLYLHPTGIHLRDTLALSLTAPILFALLAAWVVPIRPAANLRLAVRTVTLRATRILDTARMGAGQAALAARLSALNEAALALEEQLWLLDLPQAAADGFRERLAQLEIAAGRYVMDEPGRTGHLHVFEQARKRLLQGSRRLLGKHAPRLRPAQPRAASPSGSSGPANRANTAALRKLLATLSIRPATRATLAAVLAMLMGHSLSPERWFWAVITTFVVFLGTRSRADTLYRAGERVLGTLAGALVSLVLVGLLRGSPVLIVAAMVLCVFGWGYFILNAYARGVFFITVLVGLIYGELGFGITEVIEMRIGEVLLGCVISLCVALVVMPLPMGQHVEARLSAVLRSMREVVLASTGQVASLNGLPLTASMRALDRNWHDLVNALRPSRSQRVFVWNPSYESATGALLCCVHWTRTLARACDPAHGQAGAHTAGIEPNAQRRLEQVLARLDALIARDGASRFAAAAKPKDPLDPIEQRTPASQKAAGEAAAWCEPAALEALEQIDGALAQLGERLMQRMSPPRLHLNGPLPSDKI